MKRKPIEKMSAYEIMDALAQDGYDFRPSEVFQVVQNIRDAERHGCLVWDSKHIVSTQFGNSFEYRSEW